MLEARARAVAELRRLLLKKGEPAADVDDAIARLQRSGLLDDANFARQFARSRATGPGLSRRRVQLELARRGVPRDVSDAAIADVFAEEGLGDEATIDRVARKKLRTLATLDETTQRRRLYSFLARRGYDGEDVGRVVRALVGEARADDGDMEA